MKDVFFPDHESPLGGARASSRARLGRAAHFLRQRPFPTKNPPLVKIESKGAESNLCFVNPSAGLEGPRIHETLLRIPRIARKCLARCSSVTTFLLEGCEKRLAQSSNPTKGECQKPKVVCYPITFSMWPTISLNAKISPYDARNFLPSR